MRPYRPDLEARRYAQVRSQAYAAAARGIESDFHVPLSFRNIESRAFIAWKVQWQPLHTGRQDLGEWDWPQLAQYYLAKPESFHLAIWSQSILCGLAVGRPRRAKSSMTVEFIEGSPEPHHPLKGSILALTIVAADAYARAIGCLMLRISEPAPGLLPIYAEFGFRLVKVGSTVRYCERRIA